jgi:PAS domain S-box-containing protein
MINIPGYKNLKELIKLNNRIYYVGQTKHNDNLVLIKTACSNTVEIENKQLRHEYEILRTLQGDGIPKAYSLESYNNGLAIVMEHIDGKALSEYIAYEKINLPSFFTIAMSAANSLSALHKQNIIHKNIHPDNMLISTASKEIWIVDYRFATNLPKEKPKIVDPNIDIETLRYMSPEYTGRMNRYLDYRADLYSFGILLYQMLTGRLPFEGSDPLELVHSHLAKQPLSPCEVDVEIPVMVSNIVMKLLSKNAEDRYLSARGLIEDLKRCEWQLKNTLGIEMFKLGEDDISEKFQISQKIYGRKNEVERILELFNEASDGKINMVAISGSPGVGKTSLVNETHKPISEKNGFLITGKFDQYRQNIPYSALGDAFQELIKILLAENEEQLFVWKGKLLSALGVYGQIIIDVIPDLELIIGPQPYVKKLDTPESQNRFNRLMLDFIRVFCDPMHPLVIFLDDLQWVDKATLTLIENMMMDIKMQNIFIIISFRNTEVLINHPLWLSLKNMEQANCSINRISLNPLSLKDLTNLIGDTFRTGQRSIQALVELIMQKTGGNPFFINQFLNLLYQDELIYFNAIFGCWEWKLPEIRSLDITNNVVELLLNRLERMPPETQKIMMIGACIGINFDLNPLKTITKFTDAEIIHHLLPAIQQDLVITSLPSKHINQDQNYDWNEVTFRFRHDRIQQASCALINKADKAKIHHQIGWLIYENLAAEEIDEGLYNVLYHLNIASDLIVDAQEKDEVAELNLIAGIKAKESSAFEPAYLYLKNGIKLLENNSWQRQYHLSLKLYEECAEAAFLAGNLEEMEKLIKIVFENVKSVFDCVAIYLLRIQTLISSSFRNEVLDMAQKILKNLGMELPSKPSKDIAQSVLQDTLQELSELPLENINNLKRMRDPRRQAQLKILSSTLGPSYQVNSEWFIIFTCMQARLSFKYGILPNSAISYMFYGVIIASYTDRIEMSYQFGQLGLEVYKFFNAKEFESKVYSAYYGLLYQLKNHLKGTLNFLKAGYNSGVETGDFEFAGYNLVLYCTNLFFVGNQLGMVEKEIQYYMEAAKGIRQTSTVVYISIVLQTVMNLQGKNDTPCSLSGAVYDEISMLQLHYESNDHSAILFVHFFKMLLCYMFEQYEQAIKHADQAIEVAAFSPGIAVQYAYHFLDSLCRLASYQRASENEKEKILIRVNANQIKMKRWMEHGPMNYEHKYYLVEAEIARIKGNDKEAYRLYAAAIRHARNNEYITEEALANELSAKFCLERDQEDLAHFFLERAYTCYTQWGGSCKVAQLRGKYPQLLENIAFKNNEAVHLKPEGLIWGDKGLDFASLMKAFQTISSEIFLDNFLQTMMKIVIENAGAERGLLFLNTKSESKYYLAARGISNLNGVTVEFYDSASICSDSAPINIINYIIRTKKSMLINNAIDDVRFKNDPYIKNNQPKSALCLPIIYKANMNGIIYLDNRLAADVFSPDRIEVLNLLTSQIAISFENTKLFEKQKMAEEKYRSIFENSIEGIFQMTPNGKFINANPAMAHILGYDSPEELCQKNNDFEKQICESPEFRQKFVDKLIENTKVDDFELPAIQKDGTRIWVSLSGKAYFDDNGGLKLIEGFIIDVTEKKSVMDELRRREEYLRKENMLLRSNIKGRYKFGRIVGKSPHMQEVYELIMKAATTDAPVIIYGESGTGKELVAKEIHNLSDRKKGNYVPVNCGAIPENLLESEFFGYKRGAFTGAYADKKGYLDQAKEGSLFLDELGEIALNFQVKLLRVLEDGSYIPLGDQVVKKSNARVISATSRDLQKSIRSGMMREDFFYRIHIIPIYLPPLRNRKEDIPLLVENYLSYLNQAEKAPPVTGEIMDALLGYSWPGNVRELQNVIHRFCTLGKLDFFKPLPNFKASEINSGYPRAEDLNQDYQSLLESTEKKMIIEALDCFKWNRTKAAAHLRMPRRSLYRKLEKYRLI